MKARRRLLVLGLVLLIPVLAGGTWFYREFVRLTEVELAPGVSVFSGGGGNSLLVSAGGEALLVDTKFPPVDGWLHARLERRGQLPSRIVNTHYHYDHSQGNALYPGARIYAHANVPALMRRRNPKWWDADEEGIPTNLVDSTEVLDVGRIAVRLIHPGRAHTSGDLVVYVRSGEVEVIATGDQLSAGLYSFMDPTDGGADVLGTIAVLRSLAAEHPNARFVPGHGPVIDAATLNRTADYLQDLWDKVAEARASGLSEDEAARTIDLGRWGLSPLFSLADGLCWATARNNVRVVYRLQAGTADPYQNPCSLWR